MSTINVRYRFSAVPGLEPEHPIIGECQPFTGEAAGACNRKVPRKKRKVKSKPGRGREALFPSE